MRTKYSEALKLGFIDETGKTQIMEMGCYGIGVTRIVAAAIEQNYDERGIIFPQAITPFDVAIVPIGYHKNAQVKEAADRLHDELAAEGINVLLDNRDERPGAILETGDTVTLIKDLDVKGANFVAKRGTAVRGIALVAYNPEHIEGRVNGTRIVILTQYVRKQK